MSHPENQNNFMWDFVRPNLKRGTQNTNLTSNMKPVASLPHSPPMSGVQTKTVNLPSNGKYSSSQHPANLVIKNANYALRKNF